VTRTFACACWPLSDVPQERSCRFVDCKLCCNDVAHFKMTYSNKEKFVLLVAWFEQYCTYTSVALISGFRRTTIAVVLNLFGTPIL
jgi:hypothetical protein